MGLCKGQLYLQQLDTLCECSSVEAGLAASSVDVALDSVVRLAAGFVESAQIHPGGGVAVVQLNSTDVSLQCIHRLVLLLVKHPGRRGKDRKLFSCHLPGFRSLSSYKLTVLRRHNLFFIILTIDPFTLFPCPLCSCCCCCFSTSHFESDLKIFTFFVVTLIILLSIANTWQILLLPYRAPGVSTGLRFINGLPVRDEGILHLPNTGVAPWGEETKKEIRTKEQLNYKNMTGTILVTNFYPKADNSGFSLFVFRNKLADVKTFRRQLGIYWLCVSLRLHSLHTTVYVVV